MLFLVRQSLSAIRARLGRLKTKDNFRAACFATVTLTPEVRPSSTRNKTGEQQMLP